MLKHSYKISVIVLLLVGIGFLVNLNFRSSKIAYVQIDELVNGYEGMMEAREVYKKRVADLDANLDSLHTVYQNAVNDFNLMAPTYSVEQAESKKIRLHRLEKNIVSYTKVIEDKKQEEDQKLTTGVLNQIQSFVDEFGAENNYEMIIGSHAGTVMHGSNTMDITDEVLIALNNKFKG